MITMNGTIVTGGLMGGDPMTRVPEKKRADRIQRTRRAQTKREKTKHARSVQTAHEQKRIKKIADKWAKNPTLVTSAEKKVLRKHTNLLN